MNELARLHTRKRDYGNRYRNHWLYLQDPKDKFVAAKQVVIDRQGSPAWRSGYTPANIRRHVGFSKGIALVGATGGGHSAYQPSGMPGSLYLAGTRELPAPQLSKNRFVRAFQRWLYRVAYGENPEETNYLRDFPLEADMFPHRRRPQ